MGHMKKYRCPNCLSTSSVVKFGYRRKVHRFLCKSCHKHFSVNPHFVDSTIVLNDHLDGLSFRDLARKYHVSPMTAWRMCEKELRKLPDNNEFTFQYCNRFSSTFVFDGKFFNVKGYKNNLVLLWGVDYFRHDIPVFTLAPYENYQGWARYFSYFRIISHHPQLVVCDDNPTLKMAARAKFPQVRIQTCHNHFKENIRRDLHVRSVATYKPFMKRIEDVLGHKLTDEDINRRLFALYRDYHHDPICVSVLTNIEKYKSELLAYRGTHAAPLTSNLMESYNSHLESRLFSLKCFNSFSHAKLWMNGYILKRRFTKFTDCEGKFKHLNGKKSIEETKKPEVILPIFF